jgi:hypothetical protein
VRGIAFLAIFAIMPLAEAQSPVIPAACGASDVRFDVKLDKSQHALAQPEPGKALVYFFQDAALTRIGIDGAWVGANTNQSYFSDAVDPGEHHLYAKLDAHDKPVELTHFTAESGGVYSFRRRVVFSEVGRYLSFGPVDGDEVQYLVHAYSLSLFKVRK